MHERYTNRKLYFEEQAFTTKKYVIPYITQFRELNSNSRVLEIGCGEGGNMKPFVDLGLEIYGIDINESQIKNAGEFLKNDINNNYKLIAEDIYLTNPDNIGTFDFILMRDVIEHIHDQDKFLGFVKCFLKEDGIIFFGFPPWQMPFGGHQQAADSKVISKLPYIHLLPKFLYKLLLQLFGIGKNGIDALLEIKETGISIERFNKIIRKHHYKIIDETLYLINPNYEIKFNLKLRKQFKWLSKIPWIRNFFTTCCYYIIGK